MYVRWERIKQRDVTIGLLRRLQKDMQSRRTGQKLKKAEPRKAERPLRKAVTTKR